MDKEQIIIDGGRMSGITYLKKQLARKTAECEKLKSQLETYSNMLDSSEFKVALNEIRTGEREVWRKLGSKAQRYEQALYEIEKKCCAVINGNERILYAYQIRDIISKAKE